MKKSFNIFLIIIFTSIIFATVVPLNNISLAEENNGVIINEENGIKTKLTPKLQITYRYPYLGLEHLYSPDKNFYYADYWDVSTGKFIKTQEIRFVDNVVIREIYADLTVKEFDYKPVSKEDYEAYCRKYGYVPEEKEKSEPIFYKHKIIEKDQELLDELFKENKVDIFFKKFFKQGTIWSIDDRVIELMEIVSDGKINKKNTTKKIFSKPISNNIKNSIERLVKSKKIKILDVAILPYENKDYENGCIFYYKGNEKHPVIVLFNNETPLLQQLKIQLKNL